MNSYHLAFLLLFQFSFVFDQGLQLPQAFLLPDTQPRIEKDKTGAVNLIFKSTDGGQTWQDISEGLPENLQEDGINREGFVEKDSDLYVRAGNGLYHSKPNSIAPFWEKEILTDEPSRIASDQVFFKSTNSGKTWKQVRNGGWVMKSVESNGVLLATSQEGIIRSIDDGENWDLVISEGGVGIAVERIKDGFAAITYNTASETRRVRASYDGGKTWKPIDAGLPASLSIASIIQAGEYLFCGHPTGIFRSSDKGKTWELLLPSLEDKVFNLSVSGNVIYAIPRNGGC